ncbi:hypothetical protein [Rhodopila sp.]|uniref:phage fiber-tail adaptor protein n=1 Tax=Rhodopila sp. TaxID=2480087 RepID=UPI003BEEB447
MSTAATYLWKPSQARLVTIDSFVPVPRGSTAVAPAPLNWPAKDPGDVLDYMLDIGPAIIGNDADGIATLDVNVSPSATGDLTLQSTTTDGSRVVLWFSGGQAGTTYNVTFNIGTHGGRTLQRTILLPVILLSVPPVPGNAILTSTGAALTDQNGNPIVAV